ncbi:hypothetical protein Tco_1023282 [Tanacetum coccineum]
MNLRRSIHRSVEVPNLGKGHFPTIWEMVLKLGTDNQEKDEKQSQNDKTGTRMEKMAGEDKAISKPEDQKNLNPSVGPESQ